LTPSFKVLKILIGMAIFLLNKKEKNTKLLPQVLGKLIAPKIFISNLVKKILSLCSIKDYRARLQ